MNELKTPLSRLLRLFRDARDCWRAKALERQKRLRAAQVRIRDLEDSRADLKARALAAEGQAQASAASGAPPAEATAVERMAHRPKTLKGRATDALRKQTVEPFFGIIKSVMGLCQFLTRGLDTVQNAWTLVCLAWN